MNKTVLWSIIALVAIAIIAFFVFQNSNKDEAVLDTENNQEVTADSESNLIADDNNQNSQTPANELPINQGNQNSSDSENQQKQEVTVTYTDSGYSPGSITVKPGTKVTFVNQSSGLMWTASAAHPTHEVLPAFDPKAGITNGQSYSFTFENVGTWKYHNHLKPSHTGQIVVE